MNPMVQTVSVKLNPGSHPRYLDPTLQQATDVTEMMTTNKLIDLRHQIETGQARVQTIEALAQLGRVIKEEANRGAFSVERLKSEPNSTDTGGANTQKGHGNAAGMPAQNIKRQLESDLGASSDGLQYGKKRKTATENSELCRLVITGFGRITTNQFHNYFSKYGQIIGIEVNKRESIRGYVVITFGSLSQCEAAYKDGLQREKSQHCIKQRIIYCTLPKSGSKGPVSHKLFLAGLDKLTAADLRSYFLRYGKIVYVNASQYGVGSIQYESPSQVKVAYEDGLLRENSQHRIMETVCECKIDDKKNKSEDFRTLFISNIGEQITEEHLAHYFRRFGDLHWYILGRTTELGRFNGIACVMFKTALSAGHAMKGKDEGGITRHLIRNCQVECEAASDLETKIPKVEVAVSKWKGYHRVRQILYRFRYFCHPCNNVFISNEASWREHTASKHHLYKDGQIPEPHMCQDCLIIYKDGIKYKQHLETMRHQVMVKSKDVIAKPKSGLSKEDMVNCLVCAFSVRGIKNYQMHMTSNTHRTNWNNQSQKGFNKTQIPCMLCQVFVRNQEQYAKHCQGKLHQAFVLEASERRKGGNDNKMLNISISPATATRPRTVSWSNAKHQNKQSWREDDNRPYPGRDSMPDEFHRQKVSDSRIRDDRAQDRKLRESNERIVRSTHGQSRDDTIVFMQPLQQPPLFNSDMAQQDSRSRTSGIAGNNAVLLPLMSKQWLEEQKRPLTKEAHGTNRRETVKQEENRGEDKSTFQQKKAENVEQFQRSIPGIIQENPNWKGEIIGAEYVKPGFDCSVCHMFCDWNKEMEGSLSTAKTTHYLSSEHMRNEVRELQNTGCSITTAGVFCEVCQQFFELGEFQFSDVIVEHCVSLKHHLHIRLYRLKNNMALPKWLQIPPFVPKTTTFIKQDSFMSGFSAPTPKLRVDKQPSQFIVAINTGDVGMKPSAELVGGKQSGGIRKPHLAPQPKTRYERRQARRMKGVQKQGYVEASIQMGYGDSNIEESKMDKGYRESYVEGNRQGKKYEEGYDDQRKKDIGYEQSYVGRSKQYGQNIGEGSRQGKDYKQAYREGGRRQDMGYEQGYGEESRHDKGYGQGYREDSKLGRGFGQGNEEGSRRDKGYRQSYEEGSRQDKGYGQGYREDSQLDKGYGKGNGEGNRQDKEQYSYREGNRQEKEYGQRYGDGSRQEKGYRQSYGEENRLDKGYGKGYGEGSRLDSGHGQGYEEGSRLDTGYEQGYGEGSRQAKGYDTGYEEISSNWPDREHRQTQEWDTGHIEISSNWPDSENM